MTFNLKSSLQVAICSFISRRILNISMLSDYRRMNSLSTKFCRARIPSLPWPPTAPSSMKLAFTSGFSFAKSSMSSYSIPCARAKLCKAPHDAMIREQRAGWNIIGFVRHRHLIFNTPLHLSTAERICLCLVGYCSVPVLGLSD